MKRPWQTPPKKIIAFTIEEEVHNLLRRLPRHINVSAKVSIFLRKLLKKEGIQ